MIPLNGDYLGVHIGNASVMAPEPKRGMDWGAVLSLLVTLLGMAGIIVGVPG